MSAISERARDLAMNTTGDRVAVVLATLPGHHGQPSWSAYPMRSPEALSTWFDDWVGTPDLYLYLATFDKTTPAWLEDGAPLLSRERSDAVTSAGVRFSDMQSTVSRFSVLQNLVARHEVFFGELAQANPRSAQLRTFIAYAWDPFYTRWTLLVTHHGLSDNDADVILEEAAKLAAIRDYAAQHGIPVPSLDSSLRQGDSDMSNTKVSGGRGGRGGGGYRGAPVVRDHRGGYGAHHVPGFHGRGGYYRHGSAYPGRWWRGGDGSPVWVESDVNLMFEDRASPYDDMPPPSTDDQPIDPDAQGDAPADRAPDDASAVVQGWREMIAPFLISNRRAAAPGPGFRPVQLAFAIDGSTLQVTVTTDGQVYRADADLSPIWAALEPRLRAWHEAEHARGHTLMGFSSQYNVASVGAGSGAALVGSQGSPRSKILQALDGYRGGGIAHALVGAGISVSGGCGTRTYGNVTPAVIGAILRGLKDRGADVTGSNPWYAVTHDHGVEFRGTWDPTKQTLAIEVTDSDFYVPCSKVWDAIEPMLADQGAVPTASIERELGKVNEEIRTASQALVSGILTRHARTCSAGWFDSVTSAITKYTGIDATNQFISDHHLGGLVATAAGAVATVYGGPAAGAAAGALVGPMLNVGVKDPKATPPPAAVAQQHPPQAVNIAKAAISKVAAAYHTAATAQAAAAGDPAAKQHLTSIVADAMDGHSDAQSAIAALENLYSTATHDNTARDANWQVDPNAIEMDAQVSGWIASLFAGAAGYGAGRYGGDAYDWAKAKWSAHKAKAPASHP